ncbi:MAG: miniconductance mechanosensitive channel [Psychromonas sp.]|jgi:miniconductance mechanosensitive channel|uniref:mechanosensitive ion channel family protein n=1 Tax=Psychromonas sp. TaxID=1884585 RepID=UPI0039E67075
MINAVINKYQTIFSDQLLATDISIISMLLMLILISVIANYITKKIITVFFKKIVDKTKSQWDNIFYHCHVFSRLSHLIPILVFSVGSKMIFPADTYPLLLENIHKFTSLYLIFAFAFVIHSLLAAFDTIYRTFKMSKHRPINSYIQVLKIILWIFTVLASISLLLNKDLWALFLGMSGMMAIIMLVFKDTLLGLVAGMQITANDMLRLDDWLEMPSRGADGDVIDITLNTVKVRNWDKTITTIPTHALISESFKNWRGMSESGGRRIKRSISIDMRSVKFCDQEMLQSFMKIDLLKDYLLKKQQEIDTYNKETGNDLSNLVNGRRLTNIGTFRAYLSAYLRTNPKIHKQLTFMVRQLAPSSTGIPIEVYVFSNDQDWVNYEGIQADIFDHVLAVIPEFGLRVFQDPIGSDFENAFSRSADN